MSNAHPQWSGRRGFTLAVAGAAIGLGGIWRIPYLAGTNGGGAFVLVYLSCLAAIGVPLLIAELSIGQGAQKSAVSSFGTARAKAPWKLVGLLSLAGAFAVLAVSAVAGGWVLDFAVRALLNDFGGGLASLFASPVRQILWTTVFLALGAAIVARGPRSLERWNRILIPGLAAAVALLLARAAFLEGFGASISFLFKPDFSKLSWNGVLLALGQAFFTLGLGVGAMITYGSYASRREIATRAAIFAAALDTGIALGAGLVIFSILFTGGAAPAAGPVLLFESLPSVLQGMAGGYLVGGLLFLGVAFAAIAAAVAPLEAVTAYAAERKGWSRRKAAAGTAAAAWVLAIPCALSTSALRDATFAGLTPFELIDWVATSVLVPLAAIATSLYYGWVLGPKAVKRRALLWVTRILAPAALAVVMARGLFG